MKDDKRLKNPEEKIKSELSRQELYQIVIKKTPSKNRKFKWNEHRKVTRKEWKGMKDEIEKYIWAI